MSYGITGVAGSGKDTAGIFLADSLGTKTAAFADPIKNLVHLLFNVPLIRQEDRVIKELVLQWSITPDSLQECADYYNAQGLDKYEPFPDAWGKWVKLLGVDMSDETWYVRRSLRQAYQAVATEWGRSVDKMMWINKFPLGHVCTDVRMDNEAEYLISKGYKIIHIVRDGIEPVNQHSSEAGLSIDIPATTIYNNGTLDDLHEAVLCFSLSGKLP